VGPVSDACLLIRSAATTSAAAAAAAAEAELDDGGYARHPSTDRLRRFVHLINAAHA